jgi:hypothetical protein
VVRAGQDTLLGVWRRWRQRASQIEDIVMPRSGIVGVGRACLGRAVDLPRGGASWTCQSSCLP